MAVGGRAQAKRAGEKSAISTAGVRPPTRSATTRPLHGTEQQAVRAVPAGDVDGVGTGEAADHGKVVVADRPQPDAHLEEGRVGEAGTEPETLREQEAEAGRGGPHVEAHVLDRRAEGEASVAERHDVVAANRLQHRPRPGVRVELEVDDLTPHGTHAAAHPERAPRRRWSTHHPRSRPRHS